MYRLRCPCGEEINIRGSQAGCQLTCDCGKEINVPALSVLIVHQQRNEATPAVDLIQSAMGEESRQSNSPWPSVQYYHCCGNVGQDGSVSSLALNHYVDLVHWHIGETIRSIDRSSLAEFVLSVALAPDEKRRVEFDVYPKGANVDQLEFLCKQISGIDAPPIHQAPIAFAFYIRIRPVDDTKRSLSTFPSLTATIKSLGMESAIRRAFRLPTHAKAVKRGLESARKFASWWRELFSFARKLQQTNGHAKPHGREHFLDQEAWMQQCEALAGAHSWIDLKRALIDAPDDLQVRVALAEKHRQHEAWAEAIEWYDGLMSRLGAFVPLLWRRATLHRCVGNSQAALSDYSRAIELAPHEASFLLQRALIYGELQAWDEALRDLEAALQLTPRDPEILFQRAQVLLQQNQRDLAVVDLHEAIVLDPNFGQAHFRLGWLYSCCWTDKGSAAIDHLSRAVALSRDNADVRLHRSLAYLTQNKLALATEDCHHVLATNSDHAAAHGIHGRILYCEEQYEEAIAACTRSIELGHEHSLVYLARAMSYAATDQPTLAALDCDLALALEPHNAWALQFQGILKLQTGDIDAAMEAFHQALELAPDWVEPREQISLVHRMKDNPRMSVEEQTLLIERQPTQAAHYVNRAFALTQLQDFAAAANDYDRAIELDPENERLYFLRGVFRMNCQLTELALVDFDRVLAIDSGDDNARAYRASLLMRLNRYKEAIDDYTHLIAKHPENPLPYSGRAFALTSMGRSDQAQEDAKRAIDISSELADDIHLSTETANIYRLIRAEDYDVALAATNRIVADYPDLSRGYRLRAHVYWARRYTRA